MLPRHAGRFFFLLSSLPKKLASHKPLFLFGRKIHCISLSVCSSSEFQRLKTILCSIIVHIQYCLRRLRPSSKRRKRNREKFHKQKNSTLKWKYRCCRGRPIFTTPILCLMEIVSAKFKYKVYIRAIYRLLFDVAREIQTFANIIEWHAEAQRLVEFFEYFG